MSEADLLTEPRDYERFNLKQNPFSYSPVPEDDPQVYTGQNQVKSALANVIGTAISTGKSNHLVITGKYGNGKSHSLKYAKGIVRSQSNSVVGYVAQPGDSFLEIYHEFMYDLGYEFFRNLSHEYLAKVVGKQEIDVDRDVQNGKDMQKAIDDGDVLLSDVIPVATRELKNISKFTDFSRALVHLVYEDTSLFAWQWLSGEGLRYEQRKKMEIHTDIDDDNKAVKAFTSLKKLFQHLDYGILCLLIDEFESIARLKPKRKQSVLNSLRHVMDMNPQGVSLVIACAPEIWQDIMSEYHAFSERIGREVGLRPLNHENTCQLISEYLDHQAVDGTEPTNPFTDDAVDTIVQRSQGNIRRTISLCSRALDAAIDEGTENVEESTIEQVL